MEISSVFENKDDIPSKYTCDGEDVNPPLDISNIPSGTKSLVLIFDDPDAVGGWDHWVVFNIKPVSKIPENSVPGIQLKNGWRRNDYGGPCPPSGTHNYVFKLYALDVELDLDESVSRNDLENAMKGHVLDQAELVGLYKKK